MTKILVIFTAEKLVEADLLINQLLEKKWVACATVHEGCTSYFLWEGKKEKAQEFEIILKTSEDFFPRIQEFVEKNHSYDTPQIIKIPFDGSKKYLDWIDETLK